MGQEPFGGQVRPAEVAAGQAVAADVQLAGYADRGGLAGPVQDVRADVGQRPADRHRAGQLVLAAGRRPQRVPALGGAVEVVQRPARERLDEHPGQVGRERFAGADPQRQPGQPLGQVVDGEQEHPQQRRHQQQAGHPVRGQYPDQRLRVAAGVLGHDHRRYAVQQPAE
ncbi:hypothetical protein AAFH96_34960 [Polymorphospora sp. 2-325]|uniref:Uncharacterized protein n=1 Tax=Polymorphospora lycopeni TaxID=3140240 RepID=A0ABV5D1V9_9ACTN